jgi:hypothetical protein
LVTDSVAIRDIVARYNLYGDSGTGRCRDQLTRTDGRSLFTRWECRVDGMTPGGWADRRMQGHEAP